VDEVGFWSGDDVLPGVVASVVGYRSTADPSARIHRGLPSPYLTLIFTLAGPVVSGTSPGAAYDAPQRTQIVLGSLQPRPVFIVPDDHGAGIQLEIHPLAARAVFGVPAAELCDLIVEGADVLGSAAERLRQRLADEIGWPARFRLLQGYLRDRVAFAKRAEPRAEVREAWRWLSWHRGDGSMDGLARHACMSSRHLSTLFQRELGCGPKQVARLMRFEHARQLIVAGQRAGSLNLAAIAVRAGFFDHAHLDREFGQFAGTSPTGWLTEEHRNIQSGGQRYGQDWTA
jgi:AraC-like DNA-binding protein